MHDVSTRLRAASTESFASASLSETAAGSASGVLRRIAAGTIASISAAREGIARAASITAWSAADVPMWRATNASCASSVESDAGAVSRVAPSAATAATCERSGSLIAALIASVLGDHRLVAARIEQRVDGRHLYRLQPVEPRRIGIDVDLFRRFRNLVVDGSHRAGDRRVDIARGLHRLDDRAGLAGGQRAPELRQFDEHEIAQRRLRVVGDADGQRAVGLLANPFVARCVVQVGGNVHGLSPELT